MEGMKATHSDVLKIHYDDASQDWQLLETEWQQLCSENPPQQEEVELTQSVSSCLKRTMCTVPGSAHDAKRRVIMRDPFTGLPMPLPQVQAQSTQISAIQLRRQNQLNGSQYRRLLMGKDPSPVAEKPPAFQQQMGAFRKRLTTAASRTYRASNVEAERRRAPPAPSQQKKSEGAALSYLCYLIM